MPKNIIKCSQCNAVFSGGHEYRAHWEEKHLDDALKFVKEYNKNKKNVE
jgi:uncharacterized C2H2 Zn-finger protein